MSKFEELELVLLEGHLRIVRSNNSRVVKSDNSNVSLLRRRARIAIFFVADGEAPIADRYVGIHGNAISLIHDGFGLECDRIEQSMDFGLEFLKSSLRVRHYERWYLSGFLQNRFVVLVLLEFHEFEPIRKILNDQFGMFPSRDVSSRFERVDLVFFRHPRFFRRYFPFPLGRSLLIIVDVHVSDPSSLIIEPLRDLLKW